MKAKPMEMDKRSRLSRKIQSSAAELLRKTNANGVWAILLIKEGEDGLHIIDGGAGQIPSNFASILRNLANAHEQRASGETVEGYVQ